MVNENASAKPESIRAEYDRLDEARTESVAWSKWGPYLIECPTGSGTMMTLFEVALEINRRLTNIFLREKNGKRAVYGGTEKFQNDPYWKDLILFQSIFMARMERGWARVIRPGGPASLRT
jgi:hypothetical protein